MTEMNNSLEQLIGGCSEWLNKTDLVDNESCGGTRRHSRGIAARAAFAIFNLVLRDGIRDETSLKGFLIALKLIFIEATTHLTKN